MRGPKTGIRPAILVFIACILLTLSACAPVQSGIPSMAQSGSLSSAGPVVLTDEQGEYPLGLHMDILEDPGRQLTIEEVSSPAFDAQFLPSQIETPVYGFTDSVYWVRLRLDNENPKTREWWLQVDFANIHFVDLYSPGPDGEGFDIKQSGVLRPASNRDLLYPDVVFSLVIPTHRLQTYYVRFQTETSMTLGLTLWTNEAFWIRAQWEQTLYWLLIGGLIALLVFDLFLLWSLREINYLYYLFFLASLLLSLLVYDGYLGPYVFPESYLVPLYLLPLSYATMFVSMLLFSDALLELHPRLPKLHLLVIGCLVGWGVLLLLIPFAGFHRIAILMTGWAGLSLLEMLASGYVSWRKGFRPARFFLMAWLVMAGSYLLLNLERLGILLPTSLTENLVPLSFVGMALCWWFALADRINLLKAETESANRDLRNSEQRLSQILEAMPLGVVVYEKNFRSRYSNKRSAELLGSSAQKPSCSPGATPVQRPGNCMFQVAGTHEDYPIENCPIYRALEGQPASADDIEINQGDERITLELWASPIRNETGVVESAVAAFQDITQRKQAEAELAVYHKHLEKLVEERTAELNVTNHELWRRIDWLAAINQVNQILAGSADFTQIYGNILEILNGLFAAQDSFIAEWDEQEQQLIILEHSCHSHAHPDLLGSHTTVLESIQWLQSLEQVAFSLFSKDEIAALEGPLGLHLQVSKPQRMALIPLRLRERLLGFLGLELEEADRTFTREEANLLSILSVDIAQLIEDAHLFEQAKLLIAAEERQHLARELHDSVAQALYSISLFTDATQMALQNDKIEVVKDHLAELITLSRQAMGDMRLLIFELRPPDLEEAGLLTALKSRLDGVEVKAGIQAVLHSEGELPLSPEEEVELYWIAQEALNNVIKHAHASQVKVQLIGEAACFRMMIEDNGIGFEPVKAARSGGQGIRSIRERAEKIGARCLIESAPGQGTTLTIEVNK